MATQRRRISIGTTPEEVEVGDVVLLFRPEADVDAGEFLDAYQRLVEAEEALVGENGDQAGVADPELARQRVELLRGHIAFYLLPDSVGVFNSMKLPMRALKELIRVTAEVYGGGRPNGSSTDSAPLPSTPGTTSTRNLPRKAQTQRRGR